MRITSKKLLVAALSMCVGGVVGFNTLSAEANKTSPAALHTVVATPGTNEPKLVPANKIKSKWGIVYLKNGKKCLIDARHSCGVKVIVNAHTNPSLH